jgi:hypothetical protein
MCAKGNAQQIHVIKAKLNVGGGKYVITSVEQAGSHACVYKPTSSYTIKNGTPSDQHFAHINFVYEH